MKYTQGVRVRARTNHEFAREYQRKKNQLYRENGETDTNSTSQHGMLGPEHLSNRMILGLNSGNITRSSRPQTTFETVQQKHLSQFPIGDNQSDGRRESSMMKLPKEEYQKILTTRVKDILTKQIMTKGSGGPYDLKTVHKKLKVLERDNTNIPTLHMDSLKFTRLNGIA